MSDDAILVSTTDRDPAHVYALWRPHRADAPDDRLRFPLDYQVHATYGKPGVQADSPTLLDAFRRFNEAGHGVAIDDYITAPNGKAYRFSGTSLYHVDEHPIENETMLKLNRVLNEHGKDTDLWPGSGKTPQPTWADRVLASQTNPKEEITQSDPVRASDEVRSTPSDATERKEIYELDEMAWEIRNRLVYWEPLSDLPVWEESQLKQFYILWRPPEERFLDPEKHGPQEFPGHHDIVAKIDPVPAASEGDALILAMQRFNDKGRPVDKGDTISTPEGKAYFYDGYSFERQNGMDGTIVKFSIWKTEAWERNNALAQEQRHQERWSCRSRAESEPMTPPWDFEEHETPKGPPQISIKVLDRPQMRDNER